MEDILITLWLTKIVICFTFYSSGHLWNSHSNTFICRFITQLVVNVSISVVHFPHISNCTRNSNVGEKLLSVLWNCNLVTSLLCLLHSWHGRQFPRDCGCKEMYKRSISYCNSPVSGNTSGNQCRFQWRNPLKFDDITTAVQRTVSLPYCYLNPGADPGFDQGGAQIVTGLKLPFWGLSFVEFWCWGLIFGGQGGARAPGAPPWIRP